MEKHICKLASLLLVLSLMICTIALPVLAAEVDPCAVGICSHSTWRITEYYTYLDLGNGKHKVTPCQTHTCGDCGYTYNTVSGASMEESHYGDTIYCDGCGALK